MRGKGLSALQNSMRVLRADRSKAERKKSLSASLNYMRALHADGSVNEKVADRVDNCFYRCKWKVNLLITGENVA